MIKELWRISLKENKGSEILLKNDGELEKITYFTCIYIISIMYYINSEIFEHANT